MNTTTELFLYNLFDDKLSIEEYEKELYSNSEFEEMLGEECYLAMISTDYRNLNNINQTSAKDIFAKYIDPILFYKWLLQKSIQHRKETGEIDGPLAINLLLEATPAWQRIFNDSLTSSWQSLGYFSTGNCLSYLAKLVVRLAEKERWNELTLTFMIIEEVYNKGNLDVRNALTTWLIEGIQNHACGCDNSIKLLQTIREHLGPNGLENWDYLIKFWQEVEKSAKPNPTRHNT